MTPNSASTLSRTIGRTIGKIVKSNTHYDYVCQVYCRGEVEQLPRPTDYALGAFVTIDLEPPDVMPWEASAAADNPAMTRLVGVIYNTILVNPEFGNLGPRLSQSSELEVFSPDYLAETATLVGIIALGWQTSDGHFRQGVPVQSATINTAVACLEEEEMLAFHTVSGGLGSGSSNGHSNGAGPVCLHYVPVLMSIQSPLVPSLLINIVDRLALLFPEQRRTLAVMRNNLAWKSIVEPAG